MNILITGGTGFIGSHLVNRLVFTKHKIYVLKRPSSNLSRIATFKAKIHLLTADSGKDLDNIFKRQHFDAIIHLAGKYFKHHQSWRDVQEMNDSNINFPSTLLDLAIKHGVKYFINTGTCFEYAPSKRLLNENSPLLPYNYYAATKVAFEQILKYQTSKSNLKSATLKLFYAYGPKDNQKVIQLMVNSLLSKTHTKFTYGQQLLNFTHVEDIVDAYIKSLEYLERKSTKKYESFNIGTDEVISIKKIGSILEKISDSPKTLSFSMPYPPDEIMYIATSFAKAKKILKWSPKTDIIKGLKNTYLYYAKPTLN